jgi:hypothetical protein
MPPVSLPPYEKIRAANIARNASMMAQLGLLPGGAAAAPVTNTQGRKRKRDEESEADLSDDSMDSKSSKNRY